jgi:hypothetical protein
VCYEQGLGVAIDYPWAAHFYTLAAQQEHHAAQFSLGVLYEHGNGRAESVRNGRA